MGLLRLLLAAAVVLGHAPGWGGVQGAFPVDPLRPLPPYYAVQAFFVVSGFYMAMLKSRYSEVSVFVFWTNRYLRLAPAYFIVVIATLGLAVVWPDRAPPFADYRAENQFAALLLWVSNWTMLGADTVELFNTKWSGGLIVSQSWSIGSEIWFYLLVPTLWSLTDRALWLITAVSLVVKMVIASTDLPFFPWQQRFIPAELMFFVVGMLAYRNRKIMSSVVPYTASLFAVFGVVFFGYFTTHLSWFVSLAVAFVLFLTLPTLWLKTQNSKADKRAGEISYPVYLTHITLGYFILPAQSAGGGLLLLVLSIIAAVPIVTLIDAPINRWRERRYAVTS